MTLRKFIEDRILQLQNRKMMIPRYLERPEAFAGKKDFSLDMLPEIEREIEECKAALKGIDALKQDSKQLKTNDK